jgi:hypothetical protein
LVLATAVLSSVRNISYVSIYICIHYWLFGRFPYGRKTRYGIKFTVFLNSIGYHLCPYDYDIFKYNGTGNESNLGKYNGTGNE